MTNADDFPSTIAYLHPSERFPGSPHAEKLRRLPQQALQDGRQREADDFGHMLQLLSSQAVGGREGISLGKKAAFAVLLSIVLAFAMYYFV